MKEYMTSREDPRRREGMRNDIAGTRGCVKDQTISSIPIKWLASCDRRDDQPVDENSACI